jgi:hypothetical protein
MEWLGLEATKKTRERERGGQRRSAAAPTTRDRLLCLGTQKAR